MENFAQAYQGPYLRFTLIATTLLAITVYFFFKRLFAGWSELRRKWHPPSPFDQKAMRKEFNSAILWLPLVFIAGCILWFSSYLTRYQFLSDRAVPGGEAQFRRGKIEYKGTNGGQFSIPVKGATAAAGGIFLRFPKSWSVLGLGTYEKIVTFRGFDQNEYHYNPPDIDWLSQHSDDLFVFIYKNKEHLTIPEAVYIESPYFPPGKHTIFITHSGYIVD